MLVGSSGCEDQRVDEETLAIRAGIESVVWRVRKACLKQQSSIADVDVGAGIVYGNRHQVFLRIQIEDLFAVATPSGLSAAVVGDAQDFAVE